MQQVNPDYGLDPSLTATFSTHLFMLSASHVQLTPVDPFKHNVQKGLVFLKIQNQLVVQLRERSYFTNIT